MYRFFLIALIALFANITYAQLSSVGYGFRAGLSFSKIDGPSELGPNGEKLEENKLSSGFHIGMALNIKITDLLGFRPELLYSQRGTDYTYTGPSYFKLGEGVNSTTIFGTRTQTLNVSNSYLDIPLALYYKIGFFELTAGLNTGLLISSTAGGNIEFLPTSSIGNPIPFEVRLNHNYKGDKAGEASEETIPVNINGIIYDVPEFYGAYYDYTNRDKDLYKTLDFGIIAGLSYYLNEGLFLSGRYIYGLGDVDRNEYDVSLQTLDNNTPVSRADTNRSSSWQFSVGFSF
jgi:hypothetical protein